MLSCACCLPDRGARMPDLPPLRAPVAYAAFGRDDLPRPVDAATAQLRAATATFVRQPAVRYTRLIKTTAVDDIDVRFTVTNQGTTTGTFVEKGRTVALLGPRSSSADGQRSH